MLPPIEKNQRKLLKFNEMDLSSMFFKSGIVKGGGVGDLYKVLKHSFYRKSNEEDHLFALRLGLKMLEIHFDKEWDQWVKNPNSMRIYVQETWARLKELVNKLDDNDYLIQSYSEAFSKFRDLSLQINIIPAKLFIQFSNQKKFYKIVFEYFLLWRYGIMILLTYGTRGEFLEYQSRVVNVSGYNLAQIKDNFANNMTELRESIKQIMN